MQARHFFISADLGQANDYTAISIIERILTGPGVLGPDGRGLRRLHLRHIERPARGTPYPEVVDRLIELYRSEPLRGFDKSVVIDLTGLGRPVYDMMRERGFRYSLNAVSITGGMDVTFNEGHYNVPSANWSQGCKCCFRTGELKFARGLKDASHWWRK